MFSLFKLFKKQKGFVGAVFGIGSSSVGGALVRFEEGKLPHIIYTVREYMPHDNTKDEDITRKRMLETLSRADMRLTREGTSHLKFTSLGGERIKKIFCIFSIPWSESRARMLRIDGGESPFTVTENYIDDLLLKEGDLFEKELQDNDKTRLSNDIYSVVGKEVVQMKVNGYTVQNPYGKTVRTLDVAFFISLVPKKILEGVETVLSRTHHSKEIRSFAFPIAAFSVIRDMFSHVHDFMFIDIAGEYTEISVAKDGVVAENSGFPIGRNFIVRKIAEALSESFDVSLSLLNAYFDKHIDVTFGQKIEAVIEVARKEWANYLDTALRDISTRVLLPRSVFLIVGNFVPFFIKIVKEGKAGFFNENGASFDVEFLNYDSIKKNVSTGKGANQDYFVALESVFVNKIIYKE